MIRYITLCRSVCFPHEALDLSLCRVSAQSKQKNASVMRDYCVVAR